MTVEAKRINAEPSLEPNRSQDMKSRFVGVLAAILLSVGASAAFAQSSPAPSPTPIALPTVPPHTDPIVQTIINAVAGQVKADMGWSDNRARGQVTYFHRFDMQLRFANGTYRTVHLHQGTVINPRGYSIQDGDHLDIQGPMNSDGSINANVITKI